VLTDWQWLCKILRDHPELTGHEASVERALTGPERVMHDVDHANGENFYRRRVLPSPLDRQYLKVVVRFRATGLGGTAEGTVITAYTVRDLKRGERQRWP
jgi:hypothetical protein